MRLFADAYGLDAQQRAVMVDRMIEAAIRGCANDCDEARVTPEFLGPHPMVWGMAWQARGAHWILNNADVLQRALDVRGPVSLEFELLLARRSTAGPESEWPLLPPSPGARG